MGAYPHSFSKMGIVLKNSVDGEKVEWSPSA